MIRLTISVAGIVQMDRGIDRFTEGVSDLSEAWPSVRREFYAIEEEQFGSEGGSGESGAWAPLSPAYAAWKAKNYGMQPILQRTGVLAASLTTDAAEVTETPLSLQIGSNVAYAIFHQQGTSRMPARPIVSLSDANKSRLMRIIQSFLVKRAREAFGAPGFSGQGMGGL